MYLEAPDPFGDLLKTVLTGTGILTATIAFALSVWAGGCSSKAYPAPVAYHGAKPGKPANTQAVVIPTGDSIRPLLLVPSPPKSACR